MNMRIWAACAVAGFVALAGGLPLYPDLRGHTPAAWSDTTRIEPLHPQDAPFAVGDCLPGSINAYDVPSSKDNTGTATMTVFTCRSRSSVLAATWLYLLAVSIYPACRLLQRWRDR